MSFPPVAARALLQSLLGEGQHVNHRAALEGLGWRLAGERPEGAPHSVYRLLNHMIFWQDLYLQRLDGSEVASPEHADAGWPGADRPAGAEEWEQAVAYFGHGLTRA